MTKLISRNIKMIIFTINIASEPPHNKEKYIEMFEFIKENKIIGESGSDRVEIDALTRIDDILSGNFVRYTYIDKKSPWWNSEKSKVYADEEGNPINPLSEDINPNKKDIYFYFDANRHKLVYDGKNATPSKMEKLISSVFNSKLIVDHFGKTNITTIPSEDAIETILSIDNLKKISYSIHIPNPDIIGDENAEREYFERCDQMNVGKTDVTLTAQKDKNLTPDDKLISELYVASENGHITTKGTDNSGKIDERSTKKYPKKKIAIIKNTANRFEEFIKNAKRIFNNRT